MNFTHHVKITDYISKPPTTTLVLTRKLVNRSVLAFIISGQSNNKAASPPHADGPKPTRVHDPNGVSIGSAVFVGLTYDRQTTLLGL